MRIRRISSLTSLLAFIAMMITSLILYVVPHGRIANWAGWELAGLSKDQWTEIHINTGFLFLIALVVHTFFNWRQILGYIKTRARGQVRMLRRSSADFNLALLLTLLCIGGTYFSLSPFSTIIDFSTSIKDSSALEYGDPPYSHAELATIEAFAARMKLSLPEALEALQAAGLAVDDPQQTLLAVATHYDVSPQTIFLTMRASEPEQPAGTSTVIPAEPVPGTGKMTLESFSHKYQLDVEMVVSLLASEGITADKGMTFKEVGEQHRLVPDDIYSMIQRQLAAAG